MACEDTLRHKYNCWIGVLAWGTDGEAHLLHASQNVIYQYTKTAISPSHGILKTRKNYITGVCDIVKIEAKFCCRVNKKSGYSF